MTGEDLRFSVLGPVRAWRGEAELELGSPQQRAVLAMLLLAEGRQVGMEALQDALWDQEPPRSAVPTVRTYVSRLRKSLPAGGPADVVISVAHGYALPVAAGQVDLRGFEQLAAEAEAARGAGEAARSATLLQDALRLWRGPALAGIPGRWADAQRVRLDDLRMAALENRLELDIELGAHVRAVAELRELTETDPLRERFTKLLMLALYRSGRQAEALGVFDTTRHRLADELGIDPGPELRRMHERILNTDQALMPMDHHASVGADPAVPSLTGAAPTEPLMPPATRPTQLPADLPVFAGREADLARLGQILDTTNRPGAAIATIGGMGGIGKTTLALHWAHQAADRFPDGQLYVNLRGFDPADNVLPAGEALRGFLAALGVAPQQIPDTPDAQAGLYRTLLRGRQILIILDNARDIEQIHPLLPGSPGCAVLITSRSPLTTMITTHDARPVALGPLTPDQARDVLGRRLGPDRLAASPAAADQIIEHCAGLPLALAVVAARATAYRDLPLTAVGRELGTAQTRLAALAAADRATDVRAVFSWSYHQLSDQAGVLFRLLSVHPGPDFGVGAAASAGGLPVAMADPLLNELATAHLVTEQRPGRYALHDLLRAYAAELSAAEDREADRATAFGRLADYYLLTAHRAHLLLQPALTLADPGPPRPGVTPERLDGHRAAMDWFGAERYALEALIEATAARDGFRRYAWRLALRLKYDCQRHGYWHDWLAVAQPALRAAVAEGDHLAEGYMRGTQASASWHLGRVDEALAELQRAHDLFAEVGYTVEDGNVQGNFASIYRLQGRYEKALEHARRAYNLHDAAGHRKGQAVACEILGLTLDELGRYEEAVHRFEQAAFIYRGMGDPRGEAYSWSGVGAVRQHQGQSRQAVDSYRRAVGKARQLGDQDVHVDALVGLGDALLAAGDPASARAAWRDAIAILDNIKFSHSVTAEIVRARFGDARDQPRPAATAAVANLRVQYVQLPPTFCPRPGAML